MSDVFENVMDLAEAPRVYLAYLGVLWGGGRLY